MLIFHNVSLRLGDHPILEDVSFSLRPHRLTALVGRNGSGKSSLLSCVNQQFSYTGEILEGEKNLALLPPRERAKTVAILPQTIPAPHVTVSEMAAFGRNPYLDLTGRLTERDRQAVADALRDADAENLAGRYVDTLSGGERQRAALAMILAQNTPIALLDEPTAHLDQTYEASFLKQLNQIKAARKKTFLVVLHDLALVARYADDIIVLEGGRVAFTGTKEACLQRNVLEDTFRLKRFSICTQGIERTFFSAL